MAHLLVTLKIDYPSDADHFLSIWMYENTDDKNMIYDIFTPKELIGAEIVDVKEEQEDE